MYCRKCGVQIPDDSAFCPKCGAATEGPVSQPEQQEEYSRSRFADEYEDTERNYLHDKVFEPQDYHHRDVIGNEERRGPNLVPIIAGIIVLAVAALVIFVVLPTLGVYLFDGQKKAESHTEYVIEESDAPMPSAEDAAMPDAEETEAAVTDSEKETAKLTGPVEMPDLSGMEQLEARSKLEQLGLRYVTEYEESADVADGCVIRQSIEAGQKADASEKVVLYVAMTQKNGTKKETAKKDEAQTETGAGSTALPVFSRAEASSEAFYEDDSNHNDYDAYNVLDGNSKTAWNEGGVGSGAGEWIKLSADTPQHVKGVRIKAGYAKSTKIYSQNSRPKKITLYLSDGNRKSVTLEDLYDEYQTIEFKEEHDLYDIMIYIDSVYEGTKYEDCCITDVEFF